MTNELRWHKSSYSNNGGDCVEVAPHLAATHGIVPVRDSKNPHGPTLTPTTNAYTRFVAGITSGELGGI